jgi:hypothetical protein
VPGPSTPNHLALLWWVFLHNFYDAEFSCWCCWCYYWCVLMFVCVMFLFLKNNQSAINVLQNNKFWPIDVRKR